MSKTGYHAEGAPNPAGPYSHGVVANGFLFTAGFGPQDAANDHAVASTVTEQTRQVLQNVKTVLAVHNLTMDDIVKTTVHLQDLNDFTEFNEAYGEFFTEPYPARTTVGSQLANILVEIDVIAAFPDA